MNIEIIMALIGIGSGVISSGATYLFSRRKQDAETDHTLIEGMQDSLKFYEHLSDDTKDRLDKAVDERNALSLRIDAQSKELIELQHELRKLSVSICYDLSCELRKRKREEKKTQSELCTKSKIGKGNETDK